MSLIAKLPNELLERVLSIVCAFGTPDDVHSASSACSSWHAVVREHIACPVIQVRRYLVQGGMCAGVMLPDVMSETYLNGFARGLCRVVGEYALWHSLLRHRTTLDLGVPRICDMYIVRPHRRNGTAVHCRLPSRRLKR